jgi:RNA polymerase sigma factor (sigma-70 family)
VALFRDGNEEAFRVIHERYHQRLFAYARQMLPGPRQDAEDALQDIFVRAYSGLRSSNRQLALRAWLYRVAHNRCVDELRRPAPPSPEVMEIVRPPIHDPIAEAELRESLRRLVADMRRLPEHQRSALLMRELGGMAYADLAAALDVSVPAVKSLLVRARIGLAHAMEARDTACHEIREELSTAYDRGVRPSGLAKRHMHDCVGCRNFRVQIRSTSRQLAALVPIGPLAMITNLFGFGGGAAGGGAARAGGVAGTGAVASIGAVAGGAATHVATILAAAVVTAGGAVEIQSSVSSTPHRVTHHVAIGAAGESVVPSQAGSGATGQSGASSPAGQSAAASPSVPSRTQANPAAAAADSTAGPAIPSIDQLNPAANAAGTSSSAATGSTAASGANSGLSSNPPGTGDGTNPSAAGGTGSGEGTYPGMGTSLPGTGTSPAGTGAGSATGSTGDAASGSSNAPAPNDGTSGPGSTSSTTAGTAVPAHGSSTSAAHLAAPATAAGGAAIPARASGTVGLRSRLFGRRSERRPRHR